MKKPRKKQTLGKPAKRGPKPPACGRLRLSINMKRPSWKIVAAMPGDGWTEKMEAVVAQMVAAVSRLDEIESQRKISEGL